MLAKAALPFGLVDVFDPAGRVESCEGPPRIDRDARRRLRIRNRSRCPVLGVGRQLHPGPRLDVSESTGRRTRRPLGGRHHCSRLALIAFQGSWCGPGDEARRLRRGAGKGGRRAISRRSSVLVDLGHPGRCRCRPVARPGRPFEPRSPAGVVDGPASRRGGACTCPASAMGVGAAHFGGPRTHAGHDVRLDAERGGEGAELSRAATARCAARAPGVHVGRRAPEFSAAWPEHAGGTTTWWLGPNDAARRRACIVLRWR